MPTEPSERDEPGWLDRETKAAIKEMKRWPKWMREAARFEPFGRKEDGHD